MKVLLAENAGFCFGVKLAVDSAIKTQNEYNKKIYTLGPLIHNSDVVNYLEENNILRQWMADGNLDAICVSNSYKYNIILLDYAIETTNLKEEIANYKK